MNARLLLILLLLTIGFRIVQLSADPPADFDWSGGYFADEGYWSHNARNQVLFGSSVQDDWDARVVTPVFAAFQSLVFKIAGPGLNQVRIIGVLSALLFATATFFLAKKQWDSGTAFGIGAVVSLNFPMLVLSRQGIPDPFAAALAWGALCLLLMNSIPAAFLAGILLIVALITKYFMIYTLAPLILLIFFWNKIQKSGMLAFATGVAIAVGIWIFWNLIPNGETISSYNRFYSSQQSQQNWALTPVLQNIILQPFYLYAVKTPAILFFGNIMLWFVAIRFRETKPIERTVWIWLIAGILFFALWRYRPLRYYTSLFPALAVLACMAVVYRDSLAQSFREGRFRFLLWIGIAIPILQIGFVLVDRWFQLNQVPPQLGISSFDAVLFIVLSVAGVFCLLRNNVKWLPILLFAGMLLSDGRNYLQWMIKPEHKAREISYDLQNRIPNAVLSGQWAPELVLENRLRAVPVWKDFVNSDQPFEKHKITHLLMWRYPLGDELAKFSEWYPEEMKQFRFVKKYRIKDSDLFLFEKTDVGTGLTHARVNLEQ
jgi:4-amino-4-deoxy-L-arabinose transferase-like glycosyltransferase